VRRPKQLSSEEQGPEVLKIKIKALMGVVDLDPLRPWLTPGGVASEAPPSAGGEARATMWDGRPRPSDHRKRLGNWL